MWLSCSHSNRKLVCKSNCCTEYSDSVRPGEDYLVGWVLQPLPSLSEDTDNPDRAHCNFKDGHHLNSQPPLRLDVRDDDDIGICPFAQLWVRTHASKRQNFQETVFTFWPELIWAIYMLVLCPMTILRGWCNSSLKHKFLLRAKGNALLTTLGKNINLQDPPK